MRAAFWGPVQLAQAAAEGFDLVFVGNLLALGQLERLQHVLHVVQGAAERLDDVVDLLDGFLDRHRLRGSRLPDGHRLFRSRFAESPWFFRAWFPDCHRWFGARFPKGRRGSFAFERGAFGNRLNRLSRFFCGWS